MRPTRNTVTPDITPNTATRNTITPDTATPDTITPNTVTPKPSLLTPPHPTQYRV